jgi:hypothetical protein
MCIRSSPEAAATVLASTTVDVRIAVAGVSHSRPKHTRPIVIAISSTAVWKPR